MSYRKLLRRDLLETRSVRDMERVSLIRTLIAAIENAEAVDPTEADLRTEVSRRRLSDDEVLDIIRNEGADLRQAADDYERRGNPEEARRLRGLSEVANRYADGIRREHTRR